MMRSSLARATRSDSDPADDRRRTSLAVLDAYRRSGRIVVDMTDPKLSIAERDALARIVYRQHGIEIGGRR